MSNVPIDQINRYQKNSRIGFDEKIKHGFRDGGRSMTFDANGKPSNSPYREIIVFEHPDKDPVLKDLITTIKRETKGLKTNSEKAFMIKEVLRHILPERDVGRNEAILNTIAGGSFVGKEITLGQIIQSRSAVCRHYSLLFKVLADAIDLPAALTRGYVVDDRGAGAHTWNEFRDETGEALVCDVMWNDAMRMDNSRVERYLTTNRRKMYAGKGKALETIKNAGWVSAKDKSGKEEFYVDINQLGHERMRDLQLSLREKGLAYEFKQSSVRGGTHVIAVDRAALSKIIAKPVMN